MTHTDRLEHQGSIHVALQITRWLSRPRSLPADVLFALTFLLLVLAPLSPMLIHVLF